MKKSSIIFLVFIVLFGLFLSEINDFTGEAFRWWRFRSCKDTDNGLDYHTQGTITYKYWGRTRTYTDRCRGDLLYEYYCKYSRVRVKRFICPNGCQNGICLEKPTCTDTDEGLNYYVKGETVFETIGFSLANPDECAFISSYQDGNPSGWQSTPFCSGNDCYVQEAFCRTDSEGNFIDADATELFKCPYGCQDGACLKELVQQEPTYCKKVYDNGDSSNRVDIVFISDRYDNIELWSNDVEKLIDLKGENYGFFSVEPMKSNKNKFNIWRIDLLNNNFWDVENGYFDGNNIEKVKELASSCTDYDIIFLILDNKGSLLLYGGAGSYSTSLAYITRTRGSEVLATRSLVHEFGHGFVNLGDEYTNDRNMQDFSERPNLDIEGCPKWCSGELNEGSACYSEYMEFRNCLYSATNNLAQRYNEECSYNWNLPNCNLGKGCKEGTGCYWNAKSIISFRSSQKSIMKYPEEDPFEFNLISQEAILNKINLLAGVS